MRLIRSTPAGDLAEYYDPTLWRLLEPKLREMRQQQLAIAATCMSSEHPYQKGILRGLDMVREAANELMRNRDEDTED